MDVRTFPVLADDDQDLIDRLSAGLGRNAARVLAYLLGRLEDDSLDGTATLLAVRVGTGLNKRAARNGLDRLERIGAVEEAEAATTTPGRPPTAWRATDSRAETIDRVDVRHAERLLEQGRRFDESAAVNRDDAEQPVDTDRADALDPSVTAPLAVGLNWHANGFHQSLFAAADRAGPAIDFRENAGSVGAARAVAEGDVDVGVVGAATVLCERDRGLAIVPIASLFQRSTVVLYTTREAFDGPFAELAQLRGRRLGMPPGTETGLLGRLLLEQAGVREEVEVVELDGEERTALRSGTVDVVTGMVSDARCLDDAGRSVDVIPVAEKYPIPGPTLIASRDALHRDDARLRTFLAAATAGWARAARGSASAAAEIATRTNDAPDRVRRTFRLASERFGDSEEVRKRGWGWHEPDDWHSFRAALVQGGVLRDD